MTTQIIYDNVVKTYGKHNALNGLSITFAKGQVIALLGPNGAGKTTAVSLLLNLVKPTSGQIRIGDLPPGHKELRERIGALLQETPAPDGLTVRETLQLFRSYYRQPLSLERLIQIAGLEKEANKRATALSGGQKRRLAFAMAMAGDPEIIVLDEPTVGMDVESRFRFWEVIKALAKDGRTILLTTHYLEEADAVADRIIVIADGQLIAEGTPEQLKADMPLRKLSFKVGSIPSEAEWFSLPGVEEVVVDGNQVQLTVSDSDALLPYLLQSEWQVTDIGVQTATLESVFQQLTRKNESNDTRGVRS